MSAPMLFKLENSTDERGSFAKIANSLPKDFIEFADSDVQIFYSISQQNVIRGFHYQSDSYSSTRLVVCINGTINDHTININPKSEDYGKMVTFNLQSKDFTGLLIPPDYAHAFEVLSQTATLLYLMNKSYDHKNDKVINPMSFENIWVTKKPIISVRDVGAPFFRKRENR
jgi:dTDP-4-dehydrorhamnose 3,5-epimerase